MSNKDPQLHPLDKKLIRQSFDAAAEHYDDVAVLQREVGQRLIERLELIKFTPQIILDVGAGTGFVSRELDKFYKNSRVLSMDIAPRMLQVARSNNSWMNKWFGDQDYICGDAEFLPFADNSVDLIFSNLTLQWCGELERTFAEFRRVLKPEGLLMFSSFGPDTLKELRHSWHVADENEGSERSHVNDFIDMHDIGDALLRAGLSDPVMDVDNITLTYSDVYQLMRELKALGAHNVANARRHSLTGKTRLKNMVSAYEAFRNDGLLPATYEVVYGHAWGISDGQSFEITLSSLTDTGILP
jgi:malonyl-CoA O-methyltransferase